MDRGESNEVEKERKNGEKDSEKHEMQIITKSSKYRKK